MRAKRADGEGEPVTTYSSHSSISYKNGKAAAGENAPAAVPPATMPVKLLCESVKTHRREDVKTYLTSGQFLDSFARSLMDRPNRLMKPAESAWL